VHIVIAGWYRPGTGFSRVLQEIAARFVWRARVSWIGIGAEGERRTLDNGVALWPVPTGCGDPVGAYLIRDNWAELASDALLVLNDLWYLEHYARVLQPILAGVPMLGYLPLDGSIPADLTLPRLDGFHALATFTRVAALELTAALRAQGQSLPVSVVGHGVETSVFKPHDDLEEVGFSARPRMRRAQPLFDLPEPAFVVLNASRPDPRKCIGLSIAAFAQFVAQRKQRYPAYLCLHQAIAHAEQAQTLRTQISELGLDGKVIWWPKESGPVDDTTLNALYNACALGLNSSLGEGFGLVSFEHAATGAPQLLPDSPTLAELWGDAASRFGPLTPIQTPNSPLMMAIAAPEIVAQALLALECPERYATLARAAFNKARASELSWDDVAEALWGLCITTTHS
jgi:D-inositol-3-phosphate glycosyltransferase